MQRSQFVIRPFKQHTNPIDAERVWQELERAISEIYNKNASQLSFEQLYRNAYNLVLHKHGDFLYKKVDETLRRHLLQSAVKVASTPNENLLLVFAEVWLEHCTTLRMIRDILMYMDRTYVVHNKKVPIYTVGLQIFREVIIYHPDVRDRLQGVLLERVALERSGEMIDRNLLQSTLSMLVDLNVDGNNVYEEEFEQHFLASTRNFYRQEAQGYITQNTCSAYVQKATQRLTEESGRIAFLAQSTLPKLMYVVESEFITKQAKFLVEMESSGCEYMMREDKREDLSALYGLFARVPSTLEIIREFMAEYVKRLGGQIITDQDTLKEPVAFVQSILELKMKYDRIVTQCFRGEKKAQKKLKEAFDDFINRDARCASYLATYIDAMFKSGLKDKSTEECEATLDQIIIIFKHIQDKDLFENNYKQHLAKRLLSNSSTSDEIEEKMIERLKLECGYQFISKLGAMFHDIRNSKVTMDAYKATSDGAVSTIDLKVDVLTTGFWPITQVPQCKLPPEIEASISSFNRFYLEKHNGQKLVWQTSQGSAELRAFYSGTRKEICVSTYQMCILMLFNEKGTLTLDEIREGCAISDEIEFRRHLLSLCTNQPPVKRPTKDNSMKLILKESKCKGIVDHDRFTINAGFTSQLRRIKVQLISSKEVAMDESLRNGELPPNIEEDRKHLVEASLMRVMKIRKTVTHNELIAEVMKQLSNRFSPTPTFVKKRIDSLIEREYMVRNATDRAMYDYLA